MSDPLAGLLEGLSEGAERGYGFREDIKTRRRRRELEERLAFLREQEEQRRQAGESRAAAGEQRTATQFSQGQSDRQRVEDLRREVASYLSRPTHFKTLGEFVSGKPGERAAMTLSPDAQRAQLIGRTLAQFGGGDVNDEQALLLGTGDIPLGALAALRRARAQEINARRPRAGGRGSTRDPTDRVLRQANLLWDHGYGDYDTWDEALAEAQRQVDALGGDEGGHEPGSPPPADYGPPQPDSLEPTSQRDTVPTTGHRMEKRTEFAPHGLDQATTPRIARARALIQAPENRNLPPDELEAALREAGYSDAEIRQILGSPNE